MMEGGPNCSDGDVEAPWTDDFCSFQRELLILESLNAEAALGWLRDRLKEASAQYEASTSEHRRAVADALAAISMFLQSRGFDEPILRPVRRPLEALVELDRQGIVDPLFGERKHDRGNHGMSASEAQRQGELAAFMRLWLQLHKKLPGTSRGAKDDPRYREAAKKLRGAYFGTEINGAHLETAITNARRKGKHLVVNIAFLRLKEVLERVARNMEGPTGQDRLLAAFNLVLARLNGERELPKSGR